MYTESKQRRRRRCGPPVGRPRGTSPWCPPALRGLVGDREGGFTPTRPAKHHGGGSPLRLLPLSPGPHNVHAPPPCTSLDPPRSMEWGRGRAPAPLPARSTTPPWGKGTQSHGCGPLARQVLPTGQRVAGGSRGLGPWPDPPPPVPHSTPAGVVRAWTRTPTPPWPDPGNAPGERRSEGVSEMAAEPTPAAGTRPVAGNRPCEGWPAAYHAAGALDDGRGPPSSRINPCSGREARM